MRILICLLFSIVAVDFVTAGCDINLRVKNETKYAIEFSKASPTRSKSFQVKIFLGEHGLYDKRFMYEPSLQIPLLVRWPANIPAGSVNKQLVQNLDFAPTMLDMAGVAVPQEMQGRSFKKLAVSENSQLWRDAIYYRYWMNRAHFNVPAHLGVRTSRYKLIYFYDNDRGPDGRTAVFGAKPNVREPFWELYDLVKDPQEMSNVIGDPAYIEKAWELLEKLIELREHNGDSRDRLDLQDAFERYRHSS